MPISQYPNGFNNGVAILGLPFVNLYGGDVYWVNSDGGNTNGPGTFGRPYSTLDSALGACTANNGDLVVVAPNHSETITGAGGIDFDVAGVTVIGMGSGAQRPRFLMDGATTVTALVTAADVTVRNLVFAGGHNGIVAGIDVQAADCTLEDLEFEDNTTDEHFLTPIKVTSTTDNDADGLTVRNCKWVTVDSGALEFIELNGDIDRLTVVGNTYVADSATAAKLILCATGKDITGGFVAWNYVQNGMTSGDLMIDNDTTANTGVVAHNSVKHKDTTGAHSLVDADGMSLFDNLSNSTATTSGFVLPAIDS